MYSKAAHVLFFVLFMCFCQAYGQEIETTKPTQSGVAIDIQYAKEKGGELQDKVFTRIDSLSNKSANLLQSTTDSLNNLSEAIEGKVQSNPPLLNSFEGRVDSLQQRLNEIQSSFAKKLRRTRKGNQQLSNVTEKADKLTRRVDSLQNLLTNKMDKLNKYGVSVSGADFAEKLNLPRLGGQAELNSKSIPGLEKLSLPGMQDLKLGKIGDLKNTNWIKSDKSDYQIPGEVNEYGQLLKNPSNIDQSIDTKAAQMSEFQALNNETKELSALKELPESMLADLKHYQDTQAMKAEAKEVAIKKATDYFANHQDKLSQAQGMMSKLKKKYSYVPDSRDLSTAVKATSLKNEPLKKRLPVRRI